MIPADVCLPPYWCEGLFVTPGATMSSPGDGVPAGDDRGVRAGEWQGYWAKLMANGAKVTSGAAERETWLRRGPTSRPGKG